MKQLHQTVDNPMRRAFYETVARIPYGKVATYGQIAILAGYPGRARQVGYALAGMCEAWDLPWHRIINAQGASRTTRREQVLVMLRSPYFCPTLSAVKKTIFGHPRKKLKV